MQVYSKTGINIFKGVVLFKNTKQRRIQIHKKNEEMLTLYTESEKLYIFILTTIANLGR